MEIRLHRAQAAILQDPHRFITVVSGRRFGKSSLQLVRLLQATLTPHSHGGIRPTVLGVAPTHPQTRAVLFVPFLDFCRDVLGPTFDQSAEVNLTRMSIDFGPRFPLLRFSGAHGAGVDRLRGLKLSHVSVDEAKDVSWSFLNKVLFPALSDLRGTGLFTGTPAGRSNTLYKLYSQTNPEFTSFNFSSYANTLIPGFHDSLDQLRRLLPPEDFKAEILGRFTDTEGRYYTSYQPGQHLKPVTGTTVLSWIVGFDPGPRNRGWVILGQLANQTFVVVHAARESEVGLDTVALDKIVAQLFGLKQRHGGKVLFIAVDPSRPDLVSSLRRNRQNGVRGVNSFEHGITVANTLFHQNRTFVASQSWVTGESLDWFGQQLEDYHRKTDSLGQILESEDNDIETHTLDAFRYALATLDKHTPNLLGTASLLP